MLKYFPITLTDLKKSRFSQNGLLTCFHCKVRGSITLSSLIWLVWTNLSSVIHPASLVTQSCLTICDPMEYSRPGLCVHHHNQSMLKLMSIALVTPSNHLILCCPLLLPPSIFPSIRICSNESVLPSKWPKYWSFSFSISPSNEYSRFSSFRMDSLDLLAVQGTLKSLLQHHSSKASILRCSDFFNPTLTSIHVYWKNHSFD